MRYFYFVKENFMKSLFSFLLAAFCVIPPVCAGAGSDRTLDENKFLTQYSPKIYNTLPEVDFADQQRCQSPEIFAAFFNKAQEIAQRHHVENAVGMRLIHRHTDITASQAMVEQTEKFNNNLPW